MILSVRRHFVLLGHLKSKPFHTLCYIDTLWGIGWSSGYSLLYVCVCVCVCALGVLREATLQGGTTSALANTFAMSALNISIEGQYASTANTCS